MTDVPQSKFSAVWRRMRPRWIEAVFISVGFVISSLLLADFRNPPDLLRFIGRLHPLIVHLPIGLLLLAGLLEVFALAPGYRSLRRASAFVLVLAAVSAVSAAIAGYLLSLDGGYNEALVASHKRLGIAVAIGALLAAYLRIRGRRRDSAGRNRLYAGVLLATVSAMLLAGHRGAELTHGSGYFSYYLPGPVKQIIGVTEARAARADIANIDSAHVYSDLVAPIFAASCVSCHNSNKQKGGLRLDTPEALLKGGNTGSPLVAGSPEESDLYHRITLPPNHEDAMPAGGATPLSIGETEMIRWWIANGAPMATKVAELGDIPASVATHFNRIAPLREEERRGVYAVAVKPADPAAIASAKGSGFEVDPIAPDVLLLQVTAVNRREPVTDAVLTALLPLADQIAWLDLGGSEVGDAGLAIVGKMPHLLRLHMDNTRVSDAGLRYLEPLERLEYLNLYGTRVSDEGLRHLEGLSTLKTLYLWQTQVSEEGADGLRESLPEAEIVLGASLAS